MTIRLGEYLVQGDMYSRDYGVHGRLYLRGEDEEKPMVLRFDVTGDPGPDLMGKHIRFAPAEDDNAQKVLPREKYRAINPTQHGVTGTMTAQGWVKALPCSTEEFARREELGEAPPTTWRRNFMLEWFGPSGRIMVEMAGAEVEYCTRERDQDDEDDEGDWEPLENLALPPWIDPRDSQPAQGTFEQEEKSLKVEARRAFEVPEGDEEFWEKVKGGERARIDRAISGITDEEADQSLEDLQRMDFCIESDTKEPLTAYISDWSDLPKPDELDDEAVEAALKSLLARMVLCGVVLDVCKHYTPRDCYRLLLEDIIPEGGFHEELVGTGWIQHYSTYENCAKCDEEFELEYEDYEREREDEGE